MIKKAPSREYRRAMRFPSLEEQLHAANVKAGNATAKLIRANQ
jgi:hypothetical protein